MTVYVPENKSHYTIERRWRCLRVATMPTCDEQACEELGFKVIKLKSY